MNLELRTVPSDQSLEDLQVILRQTEALDFRVISCSRCRVGGQEANVVLLESVDDAPAPAIQLKRFSDDVSTDDLEAALESTAEVVSFGALFVDGVSANVAVIR